MSQKITDNKIKRIPSEGIEGDVAMREAAAGDFRTIMNLIRETLAQILFPHSRDAYVDLQSVFADKVVVYKDRRLWSYPYSLADDNVITFGTPEEVVLDYTPVAARMAEALNKKTPSDETTVFLESKDDKGLKWRIKVVEAGLSLNKNFYPDAVLREALSLFNGARVFVKSDEEHLKGKGKNFGQLIGQLSNAEFKEGKKKDTGEVHADLSLLASAGEVPAKLREAFDRGMSNMFGFSMDASGSMKPQRGKRVATKITKVDSVDLIIEPGAGGGIINFIEAKNPEGDADMKLRDKMIGAISKAHGGALPEGLDTDNDEALEISYREALQKEIGASSAADDKPNNEGMSRKEVGEEIRMVEARTGARATVAGSKLPDTAKARVLETIMARDSFTNADVIAAIKAEGEYLSDFKESGHVQNLGAGHIETMEGHGEKVNKQLDAFFNKADKSVVSFKECYTNITGDVRVTGQMRDCDSARFRESLSDAGNLDVLLGDAIHRAMIADYRETGQYDVFRPIMSTVPLADFRTNHRARLGGYGDLPAVAKSQAYGALASPGDEEATYAPSKRGGTESIALEDIRNDDVGLIQRIPMKMSRAAKRTLAKFVLDFIRTNPNIYDGTALFTVGHGNLGTAALDATSLAARRLAMVQQKELGSAEEIGIGPKFIMGGSALEEAMFDLFSRTTNNDSTFVQKLALEILPVWYWDDANDWALAADPDDIPGIEVGFLDGNEEPEIFVQDNPTSGSMFSNDSLTWKIRHVYGGVVKDFRAFDKSVVA